MLKKWMTRCRCAVRRQKKAASVLRAKGGGRKAVGAKYTLAHYM